MQVILGNPLGWWALSALAGVLLIHLFRQQARKVEISTLFLIQSATPRNIEGRSIDRIRSSIPLWLQLLSVLLVAWLLLEPRWIRPESVQRVVVVIDSSLSMTVFQDRLRTSLLPTLSQLSQAAAKTEWVLLESDTSQGVLYNGGAIEEVEQALTAWQPTKGTHDILPALRIGQSLLGKNGVLIFVSDHRTALPAGVQLFAVGMPIENVGFTGTHIASVEGQTIWQALVRNYGTTRQTRAWQLEVGNTQTAPQTLVLDPGQVTVLRGIFPGDAQALRLRLSDDAFDLDNHLPLRKPRKKGLRVRIAVDATISDFFTRIFEVHDQIQPVAALHPTDLTVQTIAGPTDALPRTNGIYFTPSTGGKGRTAWRGAIGTGHLLTEGLNWHDLWVRSHFSLSAGRSDQVLVWLRDKPLILLRRVESVQQLLFNFHVAESNAQQLPAFVILLHRFTEQVRAKQAIMQQTNIETNQPLNLVVEPRGKALNVAIHPLRGGGVQRLTVPPHQAMFLRAPPEPAFVEVKQGDTWLERDAVYFADAREADFTQAESYDGVSAHSRELALSNSAQDFLFPLWVLLLGFVLLINWHFVEGTV